VVSGLHGRGVSSSIELVSPASADVIVALGGGVTAGGQPRPATVARAVLAREHPIYADHPQTTLAQLADMITRHPRDRR
jgi:hypothetical protein